MVHDGKACQKPKYASPTVTRFFKIMVHDDYLKVLYLTPDFVQREPNVIDKPSFLEDSTGQLWPVTVSIVEGYPAIQNGWHKFAVDHCLEVGALLIISYTRDYHFFVRIYGRSGCEILKFKPRSSSSIASVSEPQHNQSLSKAQGKKRKNLEKVRRGKRSRKEEEEETITPAGPSQKFRKYPRSKPGSSNSVVSRSALQRDRRVPKSPAASNYDSHFEKRHFPPTTIIMDDPVSMLNTYTGYKQGEDRAYLQDLSIFEMGRNESDPNKSRKSSIGGETVQDKIEYTVNDVQMAKNKEDHIIDHYNDVFGAFPTESHENSNMSNDWVLSSDNEAPSVGSGKKVPVVQSYQDLPISIPPIEGKDEGRNNQLIFLRDSVGRFWPVMCYTDTLGATKFLAGWETFCKENNIQSGREENKAAEFAPMPLQSVKDIDRNVKKEPAAQSYQDLPISSPPIEGKYEGRDKQLIFLRDSVGRLWPVMRYTNILGVTKFLDGWKIFCKENNIQPGNICDLKCENRVQHIYSVISVV